MSIKQKIIDLLGDYCQETNLILLNKLKINSDVQATNTEDEDRK